MIIINCLYVLFVSKRVFMYHMTIACKLSEIWANFPRPVTCLEDRCTNPLTVPFPQFSQTFDSKPLYPSIEEKSSLLLYLVVKNHSFVDGNKRIAAALFLWFLDKNAILYKPDGSRLIENNTLVALTLMIAESRPEEMESMIKVIVSLINLEN